MCLSVGDETSLIKSSSQAYQVDSSVLCNSSECAQEVLPQLEMQGDLPSSGAVGWGQFKAAFLQELQAPVARGLGISRAQALHASPVVQRRGT